MRVLIRPTWAGDSTLANLRESTELFLEEYSKPAMTLRDFPVTDTLTKAAQQAEQRGNGLHL